jgi:hypothetical protein
MSDQFDGEVSLGARVTQEYVSHWVSSSAGSKQRLSNDDRAPADQAGAE